MNDSNAIKKSTFSDNKMAIGGVVFGVLVIIAVIVYLKRDKECKKSDSDSEDFSEDEEEFVPEKLPVEEQQPSLFNSSGNPIDPDPDTTEPL